MSRFLRSVLSVNDEFYHRHIIQHDLFAPVFDSFRANPVGDNLVSSAIVEMCDYIHSENIKSLIEYVVTKHLSSSTVEKPVPSLEDVSSPYVNTLTILRKAYEKNLKSSTKAQKSGSEEVHVTRGEIHSRYFHENAAVRSARLMMNEKALEDQVCTYRQHIYCITS
jgi:protein phosphatase 4 regulatory subunit 3